MSKIDNKPADTIKIDIIDGQTVRACLSIERCIPLMQQAMIAIYHEQTILPQRLAIPLFSQGDAMMAMPGAMTTPSIAGVKTLTLYPGNPAQSLPAIQGLITLFDLHTGTPVALVDAASITAIRTAAASAAATQVLANEEAQSLALIGTGIQAETHLQAMLAIRPITQISVWGRSTEKAEAFVARVKTALDPAIKIQAEQSIESAVSSADIICTLTGSHEPIIKGAWLKPGAHITLVGAHSPDAREVDAETLKRARLFVEVKSAALKEAGDILIPLQAQHINESHILGEIAQVMMGDLPGRTSPEDITAYKSLGNAAQDLVAANAALVQAREQGMAKLIEFCV